MIYYINEGFLEKKKISGKDLEKVVTVARDLVEAMDEDEIKIYKDSMFDFDDETKLPLEIGKCTKAFF